ncbi:hypothetical protein [Gimesia chilikensis]|nr:hypothetical protein [Gimesia chilikensis]
MSATNIKNRISDLREYIEQMQLPIEEDMHEYVLQVRSPGEVDQIKPFEANVASSFSVIFEESFYAAISVIPDAIEAGMEQAAIRYEIWRDLFQFFYINDEIEEEEKCKDSEIVSRTLSIYCDLFWNAVSQYSPGLSIPEEGEIKLNATFPELLPDVILYCMQEAIGGELAILTCFHYLANNWLYRIVSPEQSANVIEFLIRVLFARHSDELKRTGIYYNGKSWCAATDEQLIRGHIEMARSLLVEKGCQNHLKYLEKVLQSKAYKKIWQSGFTSES